MSPGLPWTVLRVPLAIAAIAVCALLVSTPATSHAGSGCGKIGAVGKRSSHIKIRDARRAVRCLINAERSARNLRASDNLHKAAQRHSRYMYKHRCFSHQCYGEPSTGDRIRSSGYLSGASSYRYGEVIALNRDSASPRDIVRQWMHSSSHRAEIMSSGYRHMGVGMVAAGGHAYYTVTLGWRSG